MLRAQGGGGGHNLCTEGLTVLCAVDEHNCTLSSASSRPSGGVRAPPTHLVHHLRPKVQLVVFPSPASTVHCKGVKR